MNLKATFATIVFAAAATFTQAQVLHVQMGDALVNGILDQAGHGTFTDAAGRLTNRYGGSYGQYYTTYENPYDDASLYTNYSKCAPFVTQLFKDAYNWVPASALGNSPEAGEYYTSIRDSVYGFTKRAGMSNWQSGDLLASGYFDGSKDTGHVMVIRDARMVSGTLNATSEWDVDVLDCGKNVHTNDTRSIFATLNQGGVGRGTIRVKAVNNVVTQWAWSVGASYYSATGRPIVLGYLN